jgi:colicin import membrane protein
VIALTQESGTNSGGDHSLIPIVVIVITIHFFLMYTLSFSSDPTPISRPLERLIVKTITLNQPKIDPIETNTNPSSLIQQEVEEILPKIAEPINLDPIIEIKEQIPTEALLQESDVSSQQPIQEALLQVEEKISKKEVVKKPVQEKIEKKLPTVAKTVTKKKEIKKKEVVKKETPKPASDKVEKSPIKPQDSSQVAKIDIAAEAAKAKQKVLVAKAQESIAKINKNRNTLTSLKDTTTADAKIPGALQSLHIDALPIGEIKELNSEEIGYRDELAGRLKLFLKLPEFGEVKIKLTLERSGKVSKVLIVSFQSDTNKKYIERTVPTLNFPPFSNNFGNLANYTFLISLNNDY